MKYNETEKFNVEKYSGAFQGHSIFVYMIPNIKKKVRLGEGKEQ